MGNHSGCNWQAGMECCSGMENGNMLKSHSITGEHLNLDDLPCSGHDVVTSRVARVIIIIMWDVEHILVLVQWQHLQWITEAISGLFNNSSAYLITVYLTRFVCSWFWTSLSVLIAYDEIVFACGKLFATFLPSFSADSMLSDSSTIPTTMLGSK